MRIINKLIFLITIFFMTSCSDKPKDTGGIVFMDNIKVFENFKMKAEYDDIIVDDLKEEGKLVDEITSKLNETSDLEIVKKLTVDLQMAQGVFDKKFEELSQKYTNLVTERLNESIEKFSKLKGYKIVLGSSGQGNIIFVDTKYDISDAVVDYVNKEYVE